SHDTLAVASESDAEHARLVAQKSGIPFETPHDVAAWKDLIAGARAGVTLDSGAAHVAGVLGKPGVDLFAARPSPAADMRRWAPWAGRSRLFVVANPVQPNLAGEVAGALEELVGAT